MASRLQPTPLPAIAMFPTLHIGPLAVSTHLILNALALIVLVWGVISRLQWRPPNHTIHDDIDAAFYIAIGVVAGAWLAYTLPFAIRFLLGQAVPPRWWALGTHWVGYVAGGTVAGYLYARKRDYPFWLIADAYAPMLAIALAIARVGCLLAGDAFGRETDAWVALVLPDVFGDWAPRYPTQLVSLAANLAIAALLLGLERLGKRGAARPWWYFPGLLFLLYVLLYSLQRFVFEFWRGDMTPLFGPFTWTHLYVVMAGLAAAWLLLRRLDARRPAAPA